MRVKQWIGLLGTLVLVLLLAACAGTGKGAAVTEEQPLDGVSGYRDGGGRTGLVGQVTVKENGAALGGAYVNVYPDTTTNLLGPSQYLSSPTDAEGNYQLDVSPGSYYVVARKRVSGDPTGPLAPGDYYTEHKRIIARVKDGQMAVVNLEAVPMKAPMFFKKTVIEKETDTGVRGQLIDAAGKPVPWSFVLAYVDSDMKRLPDYASTLSDMDGRFTLFLPRGGTYYLAGRIQAWDMPRPGEPYGVLGGDTPAPLQVKDGSFVEDVVITLTPFTGTYKPGKSRRPY